MKKVILFILTAALLLSASCGEASVDGKTTTPDSSGDDSKESDSAATETELSDDLGKYDFGGRSFSIYTRTTPLFYPYLDRQEATGDTIDDAVYNRNRKLEERFNFIFDEQYYDYTVEGNDAPRKLLLAGDDTYQLYVGRCVHMFNYASEGYFYKIDDLTAINTEKPYWNSQLYDNLSIGNAHYFAVGDFNISAFDFTHVLLFNKKMIDDLNLGDIYSTVLDGKWTFDRFGEMSRAAVSDVNGDSVMDENDQYGYTSLGKQVLPGFWIAGGALSMKKNDGQLVYTAPTDQKFIDVCQKVFEITWNDNIWHRVPITVDREEEMQMFCDGKALFTDSSCFQISLTRDAATDFGIIPYPKYDETQDKYYSRIEGCELFGVPLTNTDPEMTSVILEAMACESRKIVIPAYYEVALKVKFTRDEESSKMLDIAFENRVFDYGDTILCEEFRDGVMRQAFAKDNRDIVSTLTKVQNKVEKKLGTLNDAFGTLE
ncbi:MAG: hypothetical protein SPF08_06975 [Candidatus Flemingibacterium sp.]|nr:hypothetical protein [Candidatus Flemingibacterium sp.]